MQFTFILHYLTTSALKRLYRLGVRMLLRWVSLHLFPVSPAHNSAWLRIPARELPEKLSAAGGALGHLCGSAHGGTSNTAENRRAKGGKGERRTAFVEAAAVFVSGRGERLVLEFGAISSHLPHCGRPPGTKAKCCLELIGRSDSSHTAGLPSPLGKTRFCTWSLVPVRVCVKSSAQQQSPSKRCCWCRSEERILLLFFATPLQHYLKDHVNKGVPHLHASHSGGGKFNPKPLLLSQKPAANWLQVVQGSEFPVRFAALFLNRGGFLSIIAKLL